MIKNKLYIKKIKIFVDGSCLGNPGPGGYGAILCYKSVQKKISAGYYHTTNNRMELMGVIVALESLTQHCIVKIATDSQYVHLGITNWMLKWKNKNWKNKTKLKNVDLWKRLEIVLNKHIVNLTWIKGHSNHKENDICDKLAKKAAKLPKLTDLGYTKQ